MRRREFITVLAGLPVSWPHGTRAQPAGKLPTIGVLLIGSPDPEVFLSGFRNALRELGYADGQNIRLEVRTAEGRRILLPEKAAHLRALKVDIIVDSFSPALQTSRQ